MENKVIDQKLLRQVAGAFATGITVVCAKDAEGKIHGMTANSFLSVSLDPPLILFSINQGTRMLDYLNCGSELGISILSSEQRSISDQFAGANAEPIVIDFDNQLPCPVLKDCLAWYRVTVKELYTVGDHDLVICEVNELGKNEGTPLLYYSGYKTIGESI